jgi:hypothetical protein
MKGRAQVMLVALVVLVASGCAGSGQEERTQDEVAAEFVEKVQASDIVLEISADSAAPATLWGVEGPCNSYSDTHEALDRLLTDDELDTICCPGFQYEANKVEYDDLDRALRIEASPVECRE